MYYGKKSRAINLNDSTIGKRVSTTLSIAKEGRGFLSFECIACWNLGTKISQISTQKNCWNTIEGIESETMFLFLKLSVTEDADIEISSETCLAKKKNKKKNRKRHFFLLFKTYKIISTVTTYSSFLIGHPVHRTGVCTLAWLIVHVTVSSLVLGCVCCSLFVFLRSISSRYRETSRRSCEARLAKVTRTNREITEIERREEMKRKKKKKKEKWRRRVETRRSRWLFSGWMGLRKSWPTTQNDGSRRRDARSKRRPGPHPRLNHEDTYKVRSKSPRGRRYASRTVQTAWITWIPRLEFL